VNLSQSPAGATKSWNQRCKRTSIRPTTLRSKMSRSAQSFSTLMIRSFCAGTASCVWSALRSNVGRWSRMPATMDSALFASSPALPAPAPASRTFLQRWTTSLMTYTTYSFLSKVAAR
jgi:hypothetical protein